MNRNSSVLPNVLVFDFDGTICDSLRSAVEALNFYSDEFGYRKVSIEELPQLQGKRAKDVLNALGISMIQLPLVAYKAKRRIREQIDSMEPILGIPHVIRALKDQGFQLGILTSNSEENVREFLKKKDLNFFDFVYADSSIFGKGAVLKKLLKDLKLARDQVIYVGDETRDIEAAKSTQVKIISVAWGFNSKSALLAESPDFLVDRPHELADLLQTLQNKN